MWRQPDLWTKCHSSQHWQDLCSDRKSRYTYNHKLVGASFLDTSNWKKITPITRRALLKPTLDPNSQFICPRTYSTGITELSEMMGGCSAPSYWTELGGKSSTNLTQGHKRSGQLRGLQRWFQVLHNFSQKKEKKDKKKILHFNQEPSN